MENKMSNEYLQVLQNMQLERKDVPIKIKGINEKEHTITIYTSLAVKDRVKDYIDPKEFNLTNYNKHRVIFADHDYHIDHMIGKDIDHGIDDTGLWQTIKYFTDYEGTKGELAKWAWYLVKNGVGAWSIGFDNHGETHHNADLDRFELKDLELFESSQVGLPCLQDAAQGSEYQKILKSFLSENTVSKEFTDMIKITKEEESPDDKLDKLELKIKELENTQLELKREILKLQGIDEIIEDTPVLAEDVIDLIDDTLHITEV